MLLTSMPRRFPIPFANAAGPAFIRPIPTDSQIGIQDGAASLTDGFPPDCFSPIAAGGVPPFGQDANGIINLITAWLRWGQAGGIVCYDADFAAAIGGYPLFAVLTTRTWSSGTRWLSIVDGNLTDPDAGGAGWVQDPSQIPVGTPMPFVTTALPFGYIPANAGTVGNNDSNASLLPDTRQAFLLFKQVWLSYPNSQCPVLNSAGVPVGRGANPTADYNANNQIQVPDLRGRGLTGQEGDTGRLTGVPVIAGALSVPGSLFGENLHQLILSELAAHAHANSLTDPGHSHGLTDPGHSHANSLTDPGHTHPNTLTDPGHVHANTLTDPGHTHANSLTDPGHTHANSLTDPGHSHANTLTDPQHTHGVTSAQGAVALSSNGGPFSFQGGAVNTILVANGFSINSSATGITITNASNGTSLTINNASHGAALTINNASNGTGVTIGNASNGTGVTINNASRATGMSISNAGSVTGVSVNSNGTGVSINNASSGGNGSHNNVAQAMGVVWGLKT